MKKKLTTSDVIHHFANRVAKTEKARDYSYNKNELYYCSRCIAKIISIRKKIVVIDNTFDKIGSFGNGHNWHSIAHSFSDDWTKLFYNKPDIINYNKKDLYKVYLYTIKPEVFTLVDQYQSERELITNSRAYRQLNKYATTNELTDLEPFRLAAEFKLSQNKIKRHIYNEIHTSTIRYTSWGHSDIVHMKIDKPISFWLDSTKWHTEEELKILKFKEWKARWIDINTDYRYGKSYKEIYDDPSLKERFEVSTLKGIERRKTEQEERDRLRAIEREKDEKEKIEKWKQGENVGYLYYVPIALRLNTEKDIVETTKGANVPVSHARRLFKFFIKSVEEDRTYISSGNNQLIDSIGVYKLKEINKTESGVWYLKAGCHTIYKDAIDDFIKCNNLDW